MMLTTSLEAVNERFCTESYKVSCVRGFSHLTLVISFIRHHLWSENLSRLAEPYPGEDIL